MSGAPTPDLADVQGLDPTARRHREALRQAAQEKLGLSAGALASALSVARTIADLAGREEVAAAHLAEAIAYRSYRLAGAEREARR